MVDRLGQAFAEAAVYLFRQFHSALLRDIHEIEDSRLAPIFHDLETAKHKDVVEIGGVMQSLDIGLEVNYRARARVVLHINQHNVKIMLTQCSNSTLHCKCKLIHIDTSDRIYS